MTARKANKNEVEMIEAIDSDLDFENKEVVNFNLGMVVFFGVFLLYC
jgi:hypothetical protein